MCRFEHITVPPSLYSLLFLFFLEGLVRADRLQLEVLQVGVGENTSILHTRLFFFLLFCYYLVTPQDKIQLCSIPEYVQFIYCHFRELRMESI